MVQSPVPPTYHVTTLGPQTLKVAIPEPFRDRVPCLTHRGGPLAWTLGRHFRDLLDPHRCTEANPDRVQPRGLLLIPCPGKGGGGGGIYVAPCGGSPEWGGTDGLMDGWVDELIGRWMDE